jgi:type IV secretory pathway TrbD component
MRQSVIHMSLNRQKLIMGIGDKAFVAEVGILLIALNLQVWLLMPMVVPLHYFFRWLYRKDSIALNAYTNYQKEADVYDPWVRPSVTKARPHGFGRGMHC